jgi:hypothetical protein
LILTKVAVTLHPKAVKLSLPVVTMFDMLLGKLVRLERKRKSVGIDFNK